MRVSKLRWVKFSITLVLFGLLTWVSTLSSYAAEQNGEKKDGCEDALSITADQKTPLRSDEVVDRKLLAELNLFDFANLYTSDPAKNLAVQYPSTVMNGPQYVVAIIESQGKKLIDDPSTPRGKVTVYDVIYRGSEETGNRRIIGHYREIDQMVSQIREAAKGNRSAGSSMILLVGPHGSGKTEFLTLTAKAGESLSAVNDDFKMLTISWKNLASVPGLRGLIPMTTDSEGKEIDIAVPCEKHDSPFTILPEAKQKEVIALAKDKVIKLTGIEPKPMAEPCPHCAFYRKEIIRDLAKRLRRPPNNKEVLDELGKFIDVVQTGVVAPKIDAQGQEVDYQGLLASVNGINRNTLGPNHPLSWFFSGKIVQGHRFMVHFDEFFRNPRSFRDVLLEVQENKSIAYGGSPQIKIDAVILGATNLDNIREAEKEPKDAAQLDRTKRIAFRWPTDPIEAMETLLYMNGSELQSRPLGVDNAGQSYQTSDLNDLFPLPESGKKRLGPDGQFDLAYGRNPNTRVHISPHALMFLSQIAAVTRMKTDPAEAAKLRTGYKVTNTDLFQNPISRLKAELGQTDVVAANMIELREVTTRLEEGFTGLSPRDTGRWWNDTIAEAHSSGRGKCITPVLLKRVLKRLFTDGSVKIPEPRNENRMLWEALIDQVGAQMLLPSVTKDVNFAFGQEHGSIDAAYDQIVAELRALNTDPSGTSYIYENQELVIDSERLEKVKQIFVSKNGGRALAVGDIANFHDEMGARSDQQMSRRRHPVLLEAISEYYAESATKGLSLADIVNYANNKQGNQQIKVRYEGVMKVLVHELGYCEHCAIAALNLLKEARAAENKLKK